MEVTGAECLPHTYQELLDYLGQLEYGATGGYRQWIYQTCTEFGWYQSSDQPGHPYGTKFPVDFSVKVNPKIRICCSQNYDIKWPFVSKFLTIAESFYNVNYGSSIITIKVCQIISVMKT